jgi:negative regulator of genetic competence, sporulation and motility
VTKLGLVCALEESNSPSSQDLSPKKPPASLPRPRAIERTDRSRSIAFAFEEMEHLLCVCRRLRQRDFPGASEAWLGEEGKYYLLLTECQAFGHSILFDASLLSFLGEYGHQKNADMIRLYIREHARPICKEDAVGQLSAL